jgi:hypothetical protein
MNILRTKCSQDHDKCFDPVRSIFFYFLKKFALFSEGEVNILLTTERFLFYRRYTLKGANHVIFYRPPYYPSIYTLCLKSLDLPEEAISLILFTTFDQLNIERYLGPTHTKKISKMLSSVPKVILLDK